MARKRRPSGAPTPIEFELESFEFVRASASSALVRVSGRWRAERSRSVPLPLLTAASRGERHSLEPVAGTPGPRAGLEPSLWVGGFASPVELVETKRAWTFEVAAEMTVTLPAPQERVLGGGPPRSQEPASAEKPSVSELELARRAAAQERALADGLHEALQATSARADRLTVELEEARAEAAARADAKDAQVSEQLEATRLLVVRQESELAERAEEVARLERERDESEDRASRASEALEALQTSLAAAQDTASAARLDAERARRDSDQVAARADEALAKSQEDAERRIRALAEEQERAAVLDDRLATLQNEIADERASAADQLAVALSGRDEAQGQVRALELARNELARRLEAAGAEAVAEREDAARRVVDLESARDAGQARVTELEGQLGSLERELARAREESEAAGEAAGERERAARERVEVLQGEVRQAVRAGEEARAELERVSAAHETALARNREVEGLLLVAERRAYELETDREREVQARLDAAAEAAAAAVPEAELAGRDERAEREAGALARQLTRAERELARVSAAHETALARNRAVEGLLLVADRRARKLEVGWELELQARLSVARRVAATREAERVREAAERSLEERQAGARKSAQRIKALDQALGQALVEGRERIEELERRAEQLRPGGRGGAGNTSSPKQGRSSARTRSDRATVRKDRPPGGKAAATRAEESGAAPPRA